jgi:two-component system, LytTR family, sensor kinase
MKKNKGIKYAVIIGSWLLLLVLLNWIFSSGATGENGIRDHQHFYLALTSLLAKTVFVLVILFFLLPQLSKKRNLSFFIMQILAWLAICFITEQYIQSFFTSPAGSGTHEHAAFSNNPFLWINLFLYLFILLVLFAWHFTKEWVKNEKQKSEMIKTQLGTELMFLKNQVNPHFLFNTLNNLFSIAQRNKDMETADGISKLAGLMRYILYDSSVMKVSLEKEIKNISDFIALSKLRYPNDEVMVEVNTFGNTENTFIAPMILLPFVENAFKHGINIEAVTTISISLEVRDEKIIFTCNNPVIEANRMKHEEYGGIGLENVKRRLQLLYPQKHDLKIIETGNTFTVKLELET